MDKTEREQYRNTKQNNIIALLARKYFEVKPIGISRISFKLHPYGRTVVLTHEQAFELYLG